jgi:site-specific recombinase XerD
MTLQHASTLHLLACRAQSLSRHTLLVYEMVESRYVAWARERWSTGEPTLSDLNVRAAQAFLDFIRAEHTSKRRDELRAHGPRSVRQHGEVLKAWSGYLTRIEHCYPKGDPLADWKLPKLPRLVVPRFSVAEVRRMVVLAETTDSKGRVTVLGHRDVAILWLLFDTGLRVSELCDLRRADLELPGPDRGNGRAFVRQGKGRKQRYVFFGTKSALSLRRYWSAVGGADGDGWAFLSNDGRQLTRAIVDDLFKKVGRGGGFTARRCSAHTMRHSFATEYLRANPGQLIQLRELLGHSSLEMVQHYAQLAQSDVEGTYRSPADEL